MLFFIVKLIDYVIIYKVNKGFDMENTDKINVDNIDDFDKNNVEGFVDRIKRFENTGNDLMLDGDLPICVRLDGKAFHTYTRGLGRPYDERLSKAMVETMNFVFEKTDAKIGYTQSDEISFVFYKSAANQGTFFKSRVQKLVSVLTSMATAKFNEIIRDTIDEKVGDLAFFDCRIWNVPTLQEVVDLFSWRLNDAVKNSISMAAHSRFSNKELYKKSSIERVEMLRGVGVIWEDYPDFFKSGTFCSKEKMLVAVPEEMKKFNDAEFVERSFVNNFHLKEINRDNFIRMLVEKIDCVDNLEFVRGLGISVVESEYFLKRKNIEDPVIDSEYFFKKTKKKL